MAILQHVKLRRFRNFSAADIDLDPGVNVLTGANGQGKTSFLEAVHYLSLLRSFRAHLVGNLRQWGSPFFQLSATVTDDVGAAIKLSVIHGERRQLRLNGGLVEKASQFINRFYCIALVPEDIELAQGGAGCRRRFIDIALSQMQPLYLHHLQRYLLTLKSRNAMLRRTQCFPDSAFAAFDALLIESGAVVVAARYDYVCRIGPVLRRIGHLLFDDVTQDLTVRLMSNVVDADVEPTVMTIAQRYGELLERQRGRDREDRYTRCGPHRDDVVMMLNGKVLGTYGSQGQCRVSALALRLASLELLLGEEGARQDVVLLVDDVLGELDARRRAAFFTLLDGAAQVLIAATEAPEEWGRLGPQRRRYEVHEGTLKAVV